MFCTSYRLVSSFLFVAALIAQEPAGKLVLVPFAVERDKPLLAQVNPSELILREDGHPRPFTVFEGPGTAHQVPLELVLLFDTSKRPPKNPNLTIESVWDAKSQYEFLNGWDEAITRSVLQQAGIDVRMSVYHFTDSQLERLCSATNDPVEIISAFRRLLDPIPASVNKLALLPSESVNQDFVIRGSTGWWPEAVVAAMKDVAASPSTARRAVLLFSDLSASGTAGPPGAISQNALAMGIPLYPVIPDFYPQAAARPLTSDGTARDGASIPVPMPDGSTRYGHPPVLIHSIGDMSGAESFIPEHLNRGALANILVRVRNTLLSQYFVGFVPEASGKLRNHALKVELKSKSVGKLIGGERYGVVY